MSPEIAVIVEPCNDCTDEWYWAVKIDNEVYADGTAETRVAAQSRAVKNLDEWRDKNR